jgi:hypothetical protein
MPRDFLLLLRVPCRLPCRQLIVKERKDTAGFKFYPVPERLDPNNPGMQQIFHENIPFKILKEVKQACTMHDSAAPFMLGLLYSVVGDTAMPQTTGQAS